MARANGDDTADSQFFICLKASPDFNRRYTVWGKVIRGMEFVNHIEPGDPETGRVVDPDHIVSMRIEGDPPKPVNAPSPAKAPGKPAKAVKPAAQ
jgi:peptidylprolyl isomerase